MDGLFGELMINSIITNANSDCSHREFCAFFMEHTFDWVHGPKHKRNDEQTDLLLMAAHQIKEPTRISSILRHTCSRREYLNNWHYLRDHCYTKLLNTEGQYRASRVLVGLFGEVNNVVAGSKRKLVPYYAGPRFYSRIPSGFRPDDAENKTS
jgi:hypothetical protein